MTAVLASHNVRWVLSPPTKEGYYWMFDGIRTYVICVRQHPWFPDGWQMSFGGPGNLVNGGWFMILPDADGNGPTVYRSAEPFAPPDPPLVEPV